MIESFRTATLVDLEQDGLDYDTLLTLILMTILWEFL
jgi:hypothetical protein